MTRPPLLGALIQAARDASIAIRVPERERAAEIVARLRNSYGGRILEYPINTYAGQCLQYFDNDEYDYAMHEIMTYIEELGSSELYLIGDAGANSGYPVVITLSPADMCKLVQEMYFFSYLLIDDSLDFLICENHHDMICGMGWIGDKISALRSILRPEEFDHLGPSDDGGSAPPFPSRRKPH